MSIQPLLALLDAPERQPLQGQVVHHPAGQAGAPAPGQAWFALTGVLGVRAAGAGTGVPMALVGADGWLGHMPGVQVQALLAATVCELVWPPKAHTPVMARWLQLCAARAMALQAQMAHWAACRQRGRLPALAAAWSLHALALAGPEGPIWPAAQLQHALGLTGPDFDRVCRHLTDCSAWQWAGQDLKLGERSQLEAVDGVSQWPPAPMQALASASATWMPSTPADKMPPA